MNLSLRFWSSFAMLNVGLLVAPQIALGQNLIENGDLEAAIATETGLPAGWSIHQKPENAYKVQVVDGGHAGKKGVQISGKGEYCVVHVKQLPIAKGKSVIGSGWIKFTGQEGATASMKYDYMTAAGDYVNSSDGGELTLADTGWQHIAIADRSAERPAATQLAFAIVATGTVQAVFDELELKPLTPVAGNLLVNGDFEEHVGKKVAAGWAGCSEGGKLETSLSTEKPQSGQGSLLLKANAEWAVVNLPKVAFDKKKTYTLTGYARVKSGAAQIKIDYFNGDEWLGSTTSEDVNSADWQKLAVDSENSSYPAATHISATAVGIGDCEAGYDNFVLTAK